MCHVILIGDLCKAIIGRVVRKIFKEIIVDIGCFHQYSTNFTGNINATVAFLLVKVLVKKWFDELEQES